MILVTEKRSVPYYLRITFIVNRVSFFIGKILNFKSIKNITHESSHEGCSLLANAGEIFPWTRSQIRHEHIYVLFLSSDTNIMIIYSDSFNVFCVNVIQRMMSHYSFRHLVYIVSYYSHFGNPHKYYYYNYFCTE